MNFDKKVVILCLAVLAAVGVAVYVHQANVQDRTLAIQTDPQLEAHQAEFTGKYLELRQFSMRIPILEGMEDISADHQYEMREGYTLDQYTFQSGEVIDAVRRTGDDVVCIEPNASIFGSVSRFPAEFPDGDDRPLRPQTYVIDRFYVAYENPQDMCAQNKQIQELISKKLNLIMRSVSLAESPKGIALAEVQQGVLSGSYIAADREVLSNMKACAVTVDKKQSFCQTWHEVSDKYKSGEGYYIYVPAGKYQIYVTTAEDPRDPKAERKYYTADEAAPAIVEVKDGDELTGFDLAL